MICVESRATSDFFSFSLKLLVETWFNRGSSKKAQQRAGIHKSAKGQGLRETQKCLESCNRRLAVGKVACAQKIDL